MTSYLVGLLVLVGYDIIFGGFTGFKSFLMLENSLEMKNIPFVVLGLPAHVQD